MCTWSEIGGWDDDAANCEVGPVPSRLVARWSQLVGSGDESTRRNPSGDGVIGGDPS
jgi:hypothetical protein